MPLPKDRPLQLIAVTDIGAFAALAFSDPDRYVGEALELAGDELTMPKALEYFSEVMASPVRYEPVPVEAVMAKDPESGIMFKWFVEKGYEADIKALRKIHPSLLPFETWVATSWIKVPTMA